MTEKDKQSFKTSLIVTGMTCATCSSANDCPADAPACNYGFCERG